MYIQPFPQKKSPIPNEMSKPYALFWKADEFAIQLTLIEHFMFQQVKPNTYLHVILETMEKKEGSYNMALKPMLEYVSWFRLVTILLMLQRLNSSDLIILRISYITRRGTKKESKCHSNMDQNSKGNSAFLIIIPITI